MATTPAIQGAAADISGCSWVQCGAEAMEEVSWMATAPAIQGATTDIFGYYCIPVGSSLYVGLDKLGLSSPDQRNQ